MFKNNKTPERRQSSLSGVFIVNFEHMLYLFAVFLLLNFEQINVAWESSALDLAISINLTVKRCQVTSL